MGNSIVYILIVKDYVFGPFYVYGVYRTLKGAKNQRALLIAKHGYPETCLEIDEEPLED